MKYTFCILLAFVLISCKKESELKLNSNSSENFKELAITSPIEGSIIYKDENPVIELKWNKQKDAISYEIHADYFIDFRNIGKGKLFHKLIIDAQDTIANIEKLKINWNSKMYLRIRAIYSDSVSDWSKIVAINISDPRTQDYFGEYLIDISSLSFNAGKYDTIIRKDVQCTVSKTRNFSNVSECGLIINDSIFFTARYNPYYIGIETNNYNYYKSSFYSETTTLPCGIIDFRIDSSGKMSLIGTYDINYKTGHVNYVLNGRKI